MGNRSSCLGAQIFFVAYMCDRGTGNFKYLVDKLWFTLINQSLKCVVFHSNIIDYIITTHVSPPIIGANKPRGILCCIPMSLTRVPPIQYTRLEYFHLICNHYHGLLAQMSFATSHAQYGYTYIVSAFDSLYICIRLNFTSTYKLPNFF